ncbi:MAG: organic hydroperoxide resistance protein [Capsulimonadaceae bacterium]|nr:organic hydroperoxide resistance protein [Capsulimonadaceae bacterium]
MAHQYEAVVTAQGGRAGRVKSDDGYIDFQVAIPKEMGGPGGATNPEQLFAAGYSACFGSAIAHVARGQRLSLDRSQITARVAIDPDGQGGFGLSVRLDIDLPSIDEATAWRLIDEAHQVCPYSNATRGNIPVELALVTSRAASLSKPAAPVS